MAVSDWDRRELCPDGSCTGLIGPEGTCKVCGRAAPNWGDERKRGTQPVDTDDDETDDEDEDSADPIAPSTKVEIGGGEWSVRRLCSDGSCIGVMGDDGKCKVCGKAGGVLKRGEPDEDEDEDEDDVAAEGEGDEEEHEDDEDEDDTRASDEEEDDEEEDDEDDEDEDDTRASDGEDEEDDDEEDEGDEDQADDDLAAAADQLAGVASSAEVAAADRLAGASRREGASKSSPEARADDDDDRQLCPDGGCIGVIGDNGKCKVCGKEAAA